MTALGFLGKLPGGKSLIPSSVTTKKFVCTHNMSADVCTRLQQCKQIDVKTFALSLKLFQI